MPPLSRLLAARTVTLTGGQGKTCSDDNVGNMTCNRSTVGPWEQVTV